MSKYALFKVILKQALITVHCTFKPHMFLTENSVI